MSRIAFLHAFGFGFGSKFSRPALINLLWASNSSSTGGTVWCLPADGLVTDPLQLTQIPAGYPRITGGRWLDPSWSPVDADGAALTTSLSVADAGTNLSLHSEDLSNIVWSLSAATIDSAVELYGDLTLDRLNIDPGPASHEFYTANTDNVVIVSGAPYTVSAFVKNDGERHVAIALWNGGNSITVTIDLNDGSITDTEVGAVSGTYIGHETEEVTPGLWRISLTASILASSAKILVAGAGSATPIYSSGQPTYTAVEGEDLIVGGVQFEAGTVLSPYRKTTTATVSTDADINTVPTPSVLTPQSGAVRLKVEPKSLEVFTVYLGSILSGGNEFSIYNPDVNTIRFRSIVSVAATDVDFAYTPTVGQKMVIDLAWDGTNIYLAVYDDGDTQPPLQFTSEPNAIAFNTTLDVGNLDGANMSPAEFDNNGVPVCYASKEAAGWS